MSEGDSPEERPAASGRLVAGAAFGSSSPLSFEGRWREYLRIVAFNLLLTIATLGVYRFWAKTRTRRYLWSRTKLFGEYLEYTGTGRELLFGFLIAFLVVFLPLFVVSRIAGIGAAEGGSRSLTILAFYPLFFFLFGLAVYRALRYRLSRSLWRGIRGGMVHQGFAYGFRSLGWMTAVLLSVGLWWPYAEGALWRARWKDVRLGNLQVECSLSPGSLYVPLLQAIGVWVGGNFLAFFIALFLGAGLVAVLPEGALDRSSVQGVTVAVFALPMMVVNFLALSIYRAAFYREAVNSMAVGSMRLSLNAD